MLVPSVANELAAPVRLGSKLVSIAPLVASKAKMWLRTMSSPVLLKVPAGLTFVNVPAAMILLPTWVIASTDPFITCGKLVADVGLAETKLLPRSVLTADAGIAPIPRSESDAVAANTTARREVTRCIWAPP